MITTMPRITRGTTTTAWSKSLTSWTLFYVNHFNFSESLKMNLLFISTLTLPPLFIGIYFVINWYFLTPRSLVFLNSWPRFVRDNFLDRDHPGGQQDGVYNSRLFVKPGTDEVRFWTKSYFNTKENCFAMPSAWLALDHVGRKIRTRPNIFKLWSAKQSILT